MAMKLSKALGGSPQFWLNLHTNWELTQTSLKLFWGRGEKYPEQVWVEMGNKEKFRQENRDLVR